MKQTRLLVWAIGAMTGLTLALAGCVSVPAVSPPTSSAPKSEFTVNQTVAATWTDGNLYLAKVTAAKDGQITVQYADDNSTRTIPESDARAIPARQWAVGDRVLAVWSAGRFYKGVITKAAADSCEVKWDDGSAPSQVAVDRIIAQ